MATSRPPSTGDGGGADVGTGVGTGPAPRHAQEALGTLLAALIWGVGMFAAFVGLGFATHVVVAMTVKRGSATWRAAVGAVAAMFLVASLAALVLITGRGVSVMPRRVRERRAIQVQKRARAAREAALAEAARNPVAEGQLVQAVGGAPTVDHELDPTMPVPIVAPPSRPPPSPREA